jgi:hypothetical protein
MRRTGPKHFKWLLAGSQYDARIEEIEGEHCHERIREGGENFRRRETSACGRQCQQADQIVDAALKPSDFQGGITRMPASIQGEVPIFAKRFKGVL